MTELESLRCKLDNINPPRHEVIFSRHDNIDTMRDRVVMAYGCALTYYDVNYEGGSSWESFDSLFYRWHDHKGNLFVFQRQELSEFQKEYIRDAWRMAHENEIQFLCPGDVPLVSYTQELEADHDFSTLHPNRKLVRLAVDAVKVAEWSRENLQGDVISFGDCHYLSDASDEVLLRLRFC